VAPPRQAMEMGGWIDKRGVRVILVMMTAKQTMYIETTVVSAYFDFKQQDEVRKRITREFWKQILPKYAPVISDIVFVELRRMADENQAEQLIGLIAPIKELPTDKRIEDLAESYIEQGIISKNKLEDALHLAEATMHKVDFLVSWNYKDLVRATQRRKISEFHEKRKLPLPTIATPLEFFEL